MRTPCAECSLVQPIGDGEGLCEFNPAVPRITDLFDVDPECPKFPHPDCPDCGGHGKIPIGERFVSREMAIDAGQLEREGESTGEFGPCPRCGGGGKI